MPLVFLLKGENEMEIHLLNRMNPDQLKIYRNAKLSEIDLENVIFNETNVN